MRRRGRKDPQGFIAISPSQSPEIFKEQNMGKIVWHFCFFFLAFCQREIGLWEDRRRGSLPGSNKRERYIACVALLSSLPASKSCGSDEPNSFRFKYACNVGAKKIKHATLRENRLEARKVLFILAFLSDVPSFSRQQQQVARKIKKD